MNLMMVKGIVTKGVGRGLLIARKYSPEILMGIGIIGGIGSTVLACKATLKADEVIDEAKQKLDKVKYAKEIADPQRYTEMDYKKDLAVVYRDSAVGFVKLYWPAVTLGAVSIACILGGHGIMRRRNVALVAAYKAVEKSFADYRKRVVDEMGEEADKHFKYGTTKKLVKVVETDENGNETTVEMITDVVDPNGVSQYAKIFDDTNINWSPTHDYNMMFLKCTQQTANDMLHSRGHLFLNEVYEMLGFEHTTAGAVVGWVDGIGDDFVDFGIFNTTVATYVDEHVCDTIGEQRRDFINGQHRAIVLDFNVAGTMYDKI